MIDARLKRACSLSEAGVHDQALALLDETLGCAEAASDPRVHAARGWALENLDPAHLAEARLAYQAALALDDGDLWSRLGLANVLGLLDCADAASKLHRELIDQAWPRATAEPEYLELIGWCQYRLGRLEDAIVSFERALRVDAHWASVRFDLGLVLLLRGDHCTARVHYRAGLACGASRGALKVALDDLDDARRFAPDPVRNDSINELRVRLVQALTADRLQAEPRDEAVCHG